MEKVKDSFPGLIMAEYEQILRIKILGNQAIVACEGETLVGNLLFSIEEKELEFLAVSPDFRKHGVATAMIRKMFSSFKQNDQVTVVTYREGDAQGYAARKLYESLGFRAGDLITMFEYPCQKFTYKMEEVK
ncbi:MAG: GNAT family N-acetyltransferase [Anaerolineaceae bacterium]|nr:GNAT family N-acetyltransferase [Anaerolineaceae bacterium]